MASSRTRVIAAISMGAVALAAAAYAGTSMFFGSHFLPGTVIGGVDISLMQAEEAQAAIDGALEEMRIEVCEENPENGIQTTIFSEKAAEAGIAPSVSPDAKSILEQQENLAWPLHLSGNSIEASIEVDEDALRRLFEGNQNFDNAKRAAARNATYAYSEEKRGYEAVGEIPGIQIDEDALIARIREGIDGFSSVSVDLSDGGCYRTAEVTSEDPGLQEAIDRLNRYARSSVIYNIDGIEGAETLDVSAFHDWISLDGDGDPVFDEGLMGEYYKALGEKYDVSPGTETELADSEGNAVRVSGGAYGWEIDGAREIEDVKASILSGDMVQRDIAYSNKAE